MKSSSIWWRHLVNADKVRWRYKHRTAFRHFWSVRPDLWSSWPKIQSQTRMSQVHRVHQIWWPWLQSFWTYWVWKKRTNIIRPQTKGRHAAIGFQSVPYLQTWNPVTYKCGDPDPYLFSPSLSALWQWPFMGVLAKHSYSVNFNVFCRILNTRPIYDPEPERITFQNVGPIRPASVAQLAETQCAPTGTVCRRSRGSIPRVGR